MDRVRLQQAGARIQGSMALVMAVLESMIQMDDAVCEALEECRDYSWIMVADSKIYTWRVPEGY
jgi:hypothetical protein